MLVNVSGDGQCHKTRGCIYVNAFKIILSTPTWETILTVLSPKVTVSPLEPRILTSIKLSTPLSQL